VLTRGYRIPSTEIGETVRRLIDGMHVAVDRSAVEAGLAALAAGGDFPDGVIAHQGRSLGADVVVSFDQKALTLVEEEGVAARLLC
jgi:predicted nucleic-acid-binding protein